MNERLSRFSVVVLMVTLVLTLLVVPAALADPAAMPSTNDQNRINGWAHVDQTAVGVGSITLQFISTRTFYSCFEYRTDGDTSQKIAENNYNTAVTDGLYPYTCRYNDTSSLTLSAAEFVEVRMVFGAEDDERFDWTRFDVQQRVPVGNLQPSWTAPGGGGVYAAYYGPPDYSPVSPGATAVYDGREAGIIKAGLAPDPDDSNYWDEGILAFKVNNVAIASFASQALSYDVQNESGPNPVWVRISMVSGATYQFVPTTNPSGWHTVDAAAGQWQLMDSNGNATGPLMTLSELAASAPALVVDRVYLTLGMGNSYNVSPGVGTVGWVDKVVIDLLVYDFEVTPTCTTDCYVDAGIGDDAAPGTADWPFKTIQKGVDTVSAGGTVHVADGTYVEQVVVDGKDLTLVGASTAAIIQAPDTVPTCFTTSAAIKPIVCIKNDASVTVDTFTVDGAGKGNANVRFVGVAFNNAAGTVQNSTIKDIRNTPFDGAQHGVAIYAYNTDEVERTINVYDNTITGFQKNAMALNAGDTTPLVVDVQRNDVTGAGTTTVTAQNGIQVWADMGSGDVAGNTISGIAYDGSGWVATSVLNYYADLDITGNIIDGAHMGIYNIDGAGQLNGNTLNIIQTGGYGYGIVATDPPDAVPSPFGVEEMSQAGAQSASVAALDAVLALDVSDNTVTFSGTDNTGTYGIEADAGYGPDDLSVTIDDNVVTGFEAGIEIWQCQSGCDTGVFTGVTANGNCLSANTYGMRSNVGYLTVDGRYNWWGDASGPTNVLNPDGTGDEVSGDIDFIPWVTDGCGGSTLVQSTLSASTTDALFCTSETTTVVIDLADVADLYGYQFEISYDPAIASASGDFVNSFFDTADPAAIPGTWDAACSAGVCRFAVSHVDPQLPVSGSGTLAQITLTGLAPGTFNMVIGEDVLSDIDGAPLGHTLGAALPINICGYADISGLITMQGRFTGNVDTGEVSMIEQTTTNFGTFGPAIFAIADGAYSIQVPYMAGGTSYKIVADNELYLANEDTITVSANLANKNTRLWGGDANNDTNVTILDLSCVGGAFGQSPVTTVCGGPPPLPTGSPDINADGRVNIQDLSITGGNYDKCGAQPWAYLTASPVICTP